MRAIAWSRILGSSSSAKRATRQGAIGLITAPGWRTEDSLYAWDALVQLGESWYFGHSAANAGFRLELLVHWEAGSGAVIMPIGADGTWVINELIRRIAKVYRWDMGR